MKFTTACVLLGGTLVALKETFAFPASTNNGGRGGSITLSLQRVQKPRGDVHPQLVSVKIYIPRLWRTWPFTSIVL